MHSLLASYLSHDASDAADDEGKCLKAEVEILRSHARRTVSALAQLAVGTDCSLQPSPVSQTLDCLQRRSRHEDDLSTANQPGQNQRLLHCSHHAAGAELQQQRQSACSTSGGVALGQQQGSESASELELAAVEEGLSALEHQIISAALRCLVCVHLIPCMQYGADLAWLSEIELRLNSATLLPYQYKPQKSCVDNRGATSVLSASARVKLNRVSDIFMASHFQERFRKATSVRCQLCIAQPAAKQRCMPAAL